MASGSVTPLRHPRTGRKRYTASQRQRAVETVLERINPEKEPDLHAALFDVYLTELKRALKL